MGATRQIVNNSKANRWCVRKYFQNCTRIDPVIRHLSAGLTKRELGRTMKPWADARSATKRVRTKRVMMLMGKQVSYLNQTSTFYEVLLPTVYGKVERKIGRSLMDLRPRKAFFDCSFEPSLTWSNLLRWTWCFQQLFSFVLPFSGVPGVPAVGCAQTAWW